VVLMAQAGPTPMLTGTVKALQTKQPITESPPLLTSMRRAAPDRGASKKTTSEPSSVGRSGLSIGLSCPSSAAPNTRSTPAAPSLRIGTASVAVAPSRRTV
jgi:hypothetical protein